MTSKERIIAAWNGEPSDHVPISAWCFGFKPPKSLRWESNGREIKYWYSMRLEHLHTLPEPWNLEDDFKRVLAWRSLGVDDVLDVSVPWSIAPEVTWKDSLIPAGQQENCAVMVREHETPRGRLRHAVRRTEENIGPGWVTQPDHVPIFEDFNIPRTVEPAVSELADIPVIKEIYGPPNEEAASAFAARMRTVKSFADENAVPVQAWSAFGMDGVVWLTGTENAILMAMEEPAAFGQLADVIAETDLARTRMALSTPGVDMIVQRGWYSSTDFWSPRLFDQFVFPHVAELADLTHKHGAKFGYVMTTGVEHLGPRLADAGVDVLYFVDPVQDKLPVERARELFGGRMTMVGGTSALSLASGDSNRIRHEVQSALDVLGPTNRFILQPVDALFPDTPWEGIEAMIDSWRESA